MGIWDKFFGKSKMQKPKKSPFLPTEEDPLDIGFAKNFTRKGGRFLYIESKDILLINFKEICVENNWEPQQILSLNQTNLDLFSTSHVNETSGNLKAYKAALIDCEYLISNTGKILLSENQIRHFKLSDLPETIIVKARMDQLVRERTNTPRPFQQISPLLRLNLIPKKPRKQLLRLVLLQKAYICF